MGYTLTFHRLLRAPVNRVYRAWLDAGAQEKWLPPSGYLCKVHHLDAKVGGTFRMNFSNFDGGDSHDFGGTYVELKPNEKIVYTDKFDDPNLPGELKVTVLLKEVSNGTDMHITQENVPDVIPQEMCNHGWQDSLKQLEQFVEQLCMVPAAKKG
jgi:uncharacterized protein YndB with AHSA1/START domain